MTFLCACVCVFVCVCVTTPWVGVSVCAYDRTINACV